MAPSKRRRTESSPISDTAIDTTMQPLQNVIDALQQRILALETQVDELKTTVATSADSNVNLKYGQENLQKERKKLLGEIASLEEMNTSLTEMNTKLLQRVQEFGDTCKATNEELVASRKALSDAQISITDLDVANKRQSMDVSALKNSLVKAKVQVQSISDEYIRDKLEKLNYSIKKWASGTVYRRTPAATAGDAWTLHPSEQTLWINRRMPWLSMDSERQYKVKVLECIIMTTLLHTCMAIGPFGDDRGPLAAEARAEKAYRAHEDNTMYKNWLQLTKDLCQVRFDDAKSDAGRNHTISLVDQAVTSNVKALRGPDLAFEMANGFAKFVDPAVDIMIQVQYHRARFCLWPASLEYTCEDYSTVFCGRDHYDISAGSHQPSDSDHIRVSDVIAPGIYKICDEEGNALKPPVCVWKARVLTCSTTGTDSDTEAAAQLQSDNADGHGGTIRVGHPAIAPAARRSARNAETPTMVYDSNDSDRS